MSRSISPEEVKLHNSEKDCWIIIKGKVYAVTPYLNDHPGGAEIIHDLAGGDATEDYDDVGHSEEAHEILKKYHIGDLVAGAAMGSKSASTAAAPSPAKPAAAAVVAPPPPPTKPVVAPTSSSAPKPSSSSSSSGPSGFKEDDNSGMMIVAGLVVAAAVAGYFFFRKSKE